MAGCSVYETAFLILIIFMIVNQDILEHGTLSLNSHSYKEAKGNAKIREMEQNGAVKVGKLNIKDDKAIKRGFKALIDETAVDEAAFVNELFAENEGVNRWRDKAFMLKRQLAGFYLMQGMKDGDRRLPMEVYTKLAVVLYSGSFTEEEDAAILAWVDKHGASRWAELARNLGRRYLKAAQTVQTRYEELTGKAKGNRQVLISL